MVDCTRQTLATFGEGSLAEIKGSPLALKTYILLPNMPIQMLALKKTLKMQHYDYIVVHTRKFIKYNINYHGNAYDSGMLRTGYHPKH